MPPKPRGGKVAAAAASKQTKAQTANKTNKRSAEDKTAPPAKKAKTATTPKTATPTSTKTASAKSKKTAPVAKEATPSQRSSSELSEEGAAIARLIATPTKPSIERQSQMLAPQVSASKAKAARVKMTAEADAAANDKAEAKAAAKAEAATQDEQVLADLESTYDIIAISDDTAKTVKDITKWVNASEDDSFMGFCRLREELRLEISPNQGKRLTLAQELDAMLGAKDCSIEPEPVYVDVSVCGCSQESDCCGGLGRGNGQMANARRRAGEDADDREGIDHHGDAEHQDLNQIRAPSLTRTRRKSLKAVQRQFKTPRQQARRQLQTAILQLCRLRSRQTRNQRSQWTRNQRRQQTRGRRSRQTKGQRSR